MKNILKILAGPASFAFTAFALTGTFTPAQSFAVGTAVWMALWWILRPVSIYVTAFIPILVDSFFDLIPEGHVLSQYSVSYTHSPSPRDPKTSSMPSCA